MSLSFVDYEAEARHARDQAIADAILSAGRTLGRLFVALGGAIVQWRRRGALAAELGALSDHELADIGLSRCDIEAVVRGGCRGERSPARRPLPVDSPADIRRVRVERVSDFSRAA